MKVINLCTSNTYLRSVEVTYERDRIAQQRVGEKSVTCSNAAKYVNYV